MSENLIQAGNIVGSLFYGVMLGLFLVAFFLPWVGGTAVFLAGIVSQAAVLALVGNPELLIADESEGSGSVPYETTTRR